MHLRNILEYKQLNINHLKILSEVVSEKKLMLQTFGMSESNRYVSTISDTLFIPVFSELKEAGSEWKELIIQ
jgi:hypothetical protein